MALVGRLCPLNFCFKRKSALNLLKSGAQRQLENTRCIILGRYMSTATSVTNIDINEVQKFQLNPSATIVDVREVDEIKDTGKLPGSTNIPLGQVAAALQEDSDKFKAKYNIEKPLVDNPIIFSCRSGRRSMMAAETAASLGYKKVYNYAGGWLDWAEHFPRE